MAHHETLLIDQIYRDSFKYPKTLKPAFRQKLIEARRFILDDDMSAFMADIGWAAYKVPTVKNDDVDRIAKMIHFSNNANKVFDNVRHMARLPFKTTWIEWNEKTFARRARAAYNSAMDEHLVPNRSGWLLMQHDQVETAVLAIGVGMGTTMIGSEGSMEVGLTPFAQMWQTVDEPLPWSPSPFTLDARGNPITVQPTQMPDVTVSLSSMLTGLIAYDTPYIGITSSERFIGYKEHSRAEFLKLMQEQGGMLRYVLGLLAVINDLPIGTKHVAVTKGFVAKGNYRKFLTHSIVTLKVPAERFSGLARKAVMAMRRRAHQVRGHWRDDWRNPGQKIWVHEHQRGDASLGFVLHDYAVKKGEKDA